MRIRDLTRALAAAPLLAGLALAGCGGSSAATTDSTSGAGAPNLAVNAEGAFDHVPSVSFPATAASANLVGRTLVEGNGATVAAGNAMVADYVLYTWNGTTHKQIDTSYGKQPMMFSSVPGMAGLRKTLVGRKVGSRELVVVPPKFGLGGKGDSKLGITGTTTLVFVFDILGTYPANAIASGNTVSSGGGTLPKVTTPTTAGPTVVIPKTSPPAHLEVQTLIKGSGHVVAKNDYIVAQYVGYDWRTRQMFGSTWSQGSMLGTPLTKLLPGWISGLPGQTVGSRVLLVIPASQAYGTKGSPDGAIKAGDTLVFVIDVIDSLSTPAS